MTKCKRCIEPECQCESKNMQPMDLFGSPFNCKDEIPTPKFTSPNSKLSQKKLDELQECIEAANHLLRSLGSENHAENTRQLQLKFLDMEGLEILIYILCSKDFSSELMEDENDEEKQLTIQFEKENSSEFVKYNEAFLIKEKGKVVTAGRDFLQINQIGSTLFVPYNRIIAIKVDDIDLDNKKCLTYIDKSVRRELAFNFGEYVTKNPGFLNLFFGLSLFRKLQDYLGKNVTVKTDEGQWRGVLIRTKFNELILQNQNEKYEVNLNSICYLKVHDLK